MGDKSWEEGLRKSPLGEYENEINEHNEREKALWLLPEWLQSWKWMAGILTGEAGR